jgi:DNA ligase-1
MSQDVVEYYSLPSLYGTDKLGKTRYWRTWCRDNVTYTSSGLVGGKRTEPTLREVEGKNIGKRNETTSEEQAKIVISQNWLKQLEKEYAPKDTDEDGTDIYVRVIKYKNANGGNNRDIWRLIDDPEYFDKKDEKVTTSGKSTLKSKHKDAVVKRIAQVKAKDKTISKIILPNGCQKLTFDEKCKKYFECQFYIQPKYDGVRAVVYIVDGQVIISSRKGKQYPYFDSLREQVKLFLKGREDIILDCEFYCHTFKDEKGNEVDQTERFNIISSCCKVNRTKPPPKYLEDQLSFYVFDVVDETIDQRTRFGIVSELFSKENVKTPRIHRAPVMVMKKGDFEEKKIKDIHDKFFKQGYEGIVLRSEKLIYVCGKKSLEMRKYKQFIDEEVTVIGAERDEGVKDDRHFTFNWICDYNGTRILASATGTRERQRHYFDNIKKYKNKQLTIRYQELSDKGIPRFAKAVAIRDYE